MDFIGGALPNVMLITGLIAIGIGLGIQFNIVEVKGNLSRTSRIGAILVGLFLIGSSVYIHTHPPQATATQTDVPTGQSPEVPAASTVSSSPAPAAPTASPMAAPEVIVPDIRGKNAKDAQKLLAPLGLNLDAAQTDCATLGATPSEGKLKRDAIICQSPAPGSRIPLQSTVTYVLTDKH